MFNLKKKAMKKIFSFAVAALVAVGMTSCGNKAAGGNGADSTATDSVAQEEVKADPKSYDGDIYSMTLPEGWEKNGEGNSHQLNLRTTDNVPQYYATVDALDYVESIDDWKKFLSKDLKADKDIKVGDLTFTVVSNKEAFYNVNGCALLGEGKGALTFSFTGDGKKDAQEQLDMLQKVLEAVVLK